MENLENFNSKFESYRNHYKLEVTTHEHEEQLFVHEKISKESSEIKKWNK